MSRSLHVRSGQQQTPGTVLKRKAIRVSAYCYKCDLVCSYVFFIMFRSKVINKMTRVLSANVTLNCGGQLGIVLVFCHCKSLIWIICPSNLVLFFLFIMYAVRPLYIY